VTHRILYIHHAGGIGGAPLSLLFLIRQLDRARFEPVVVTLRPGPVVDLYRAEGIETHVAQGIDEFSHTTLEWYGGGDLWRLPGKLLHFWPSVVRTRRLIEQIRPDLVHLNSSTLAPSAIGAGLAGVPVVWHIREPLARGYLGLRRALLRRIIHRTAARVIAICRNDAAQLIPSDRIRVIYNFVDFRHFDRGLSGERVRAEFGIPPDAPLVVMLGGIMRPKGTLTLARALPALRQAVSNARALIAGPTAQPPSGLRGLARSALRADVYQRRVLNALVGAPGEAVILAGVRDDVPELLAAADVLVFPSSVPHFARPIIEAAAMGIPAVASNLGGPDELIEHGQTGLLVPPGDPDALTGALARLLLDREAARAMGEAAYRRARVLFDAETNARATLDLYDELLCACEAPSNAVS
jgi:glycosyltransferase involved in cell wall biosynthesis